MKKVTVYVRDVNNSTSNFSHHTHENNSEIANTLISSGYFTAVGGDFVFFPPASIIKAVIEEN